jgi:hypothetical protein
MLDYWWAAHKVTLMSIFDGRENSYYNTEPLEASKIL